MIAQPLIVTGLVFSIISVIYLTEGLRHRKVAGTFFVTGIVVALIGVWVGFLHQNWGR